MYIYRERYIYIAMFTHISRSYQNHHQPTWSPTTPRCHCLPLGCVSSQTGRRVCDPSWKLNVPNPLRADFGPGGRWEGIYTVATRTNFAGKRMDSQTKETEMSINTSSKLRKIATNKRDTTKAHRPSQLVTD